MKHLNIDTLKGLCKMISSLKWDRYVADDDQFIIYGWIYTEGKQRDFIVLCFTEPGVWYTTSSALWSHKICDFLYPGDNSHTDCKYISDLLKDDEDPLVRELVKSEIF